MNVSCSCCRPAPQPSLLQQLQMMRCLHGACSSVAAWPNGFRREGSRKTAALYRLKVPVPPGTTVSNQNQVTLSSTILFGPVQTNNII
ncbi:hypothetical protein WMY93_001507 [Mugilogobius chulae]|uniref:Uncharacterized protein n=1 Tax=Mugilogobius chulae TaxID=88201 RepID=A0AAW0Q876_9GOBI